MNAIHAWAHRPDDVALQRFLHENPAPKTLIICLDSAQTMPHIAADSPLKQAWAHALLGVQFQTANIIANFAPNTDLFLLPAHLMAHLADFVPNIHAIQWHGAPIAQTSRNAEKPWQTLPEDSSDAPQVLVMGAGIAGAATAYELARRGATVHVLEARADCAQAASGNYQGLLYTKISAHATAQTELLLAGYGYTRRLLAKMLPEESAWQACGVLHMNHNAAETARNEQLATHAHHRHLYHGVDRETASRLAGIEIAQGGLFWPQGAWLNPRALIRALLNHPNIQLFPNARAISAHYDASEWHVFTADNRHFSGSHLVWCTGSQSPSAPLIRDFPLQMIRGQTAIATATPYSRRVKIALSGSRYFAPAWQNAHCFGATFSPNDATDDWRADDCVENWQELHHLHADLAANLARANSSGCLKNQDNHGHAAVRCDAHDHLPVVGALGDATAMRHVYAKLALDKHYQISAACPYVLRAYANTAHGSRGLASAPLCAAQIAAEICGTPLVFSRRLRHALQPNRLIIRDIVRGLFR